MSETRHHARHRERVEQLCAVAVRALAGERDLHFRGGRLHRGRRALPLYAPHLNPSLDADDFMSFRGAADGFGLRLANSDATLHASLRPNDPVERMVFELLEQFRCEALVPVGMAGVRGNLRHRFEAWSHAFHDGGGTESARGSLLFTLAQMGRSRVTGDPVPEDLEDALEATRAGIAPLIGSALAGCKRERTDQAAHATHALAVARTIAAMLKSADGDRTADARDDDIDDTDPADAWAAFTLLLEDGHEAENSFAYVVSERSPVLDGADGGYRVFTTAYDREVAAATLARAAVLAEHRERLDRRIAASGVHLARLARDLKVLLALPQVDGWNTAQEEGRIDGCRLAQLVASPTERRLFRTERTLPRTDAIVSVLVDCSGSMKAHIESVAVVVDLLVRTLEMADAASEVLGFTTRTWNGGRARRDWLRAGRPPRPGRLNEVCHLVFKDAATPWRRARPGLAALLDADLFREGVDGEAVTWAMRRAMQHRVEHDEARRVLIVVSDGSPMDSATTLANDARYLDHHLKDVVADAESRGAEIYGVGVGLDLSPYYRRSHVLDLSAPVTTVLRELTGLIARGSRR